MARKFDLEKALAMFRADVEWRRERGLDRIVRSWKCVEPFGAYYKMLLRSQGPIMKQRGPLVSLFI